jgi:hypothetical protein
MTKIFTAVKSPVDGFWWVCMGQMIVASFPGDAEDRATSLAMDLNMSVASHQERHRDLAAARARRIEREGQAFADAAEDMFKGGVR